MIVDSSTTSSYAQSVNNNFGRSVSQQNNHGEERRPWSPTKDFFGLRKIFTPYRESDHNILNRDFVSILHKLGGVTSSLASTCNSGTEKRCVARFSPHICPSEFSQKKQSSSPQSTKRPRFNRTVAAIDPRRICCVVSRRVA